MTRKFQKGFSGILILLVVFAVAAGLVFFTLQKGSNSSSTTTEGQSQKPSKESSWTETGVVITGRYADADIVDLGNGKFRMYYSAEPEVPGFMGQVYSSISSDGINWIQEEGTRITSATFPSVIKPEDGTYRMYFQEQRAIKSAKSADGLVWEAEQGTRIDATNTTGLTLAGVLAPTVIKTGNEYLMVYAGAINKPYEKEKVPNKETHPLLWATSKDGLTFEKKGIALDSRNEIFKGWMDGPELVVWDDGAIRLYFWGYGGVYLSVFEKGNFSEPKFVFFGPNYDEKVLFSPSPPGDPTLAKINNVWNMYYGYHEKGIYRAVLKK